MNKDFEIESWINLNAKRKGIWKIKWRYCGWNFAKIIFFEINAKFTKNPNYDENNKKSWIKFVKKLLY